MQGPNSCAGNCTNRVVVKGVIDGSDDGVLGFVIVSHQDVEDARSGLQQLRTRVLAVARIHHGQILLAGQRRFSLREAPERAFGILDFQAAGPVGIVALQSLQRLDEGIQPPVRCWGRVHPQQLPQHLDEREARGDRPMLHSLGKLSRQRCSDTRVAWY